MTRLQQQSGTFEQLNCKCRYPPEELTRSRNMRCSMNDISRLEAKYHKTSGIADAEGGRQGDRGAKSRYFGLTLQLPLGSYKY
jgi:hypothetical protein